MRLEHKKGSLHASHVRKAFLLAVRANLPEEVFAELDSMPKRPEMVEDWAASHGINAPCVVEEFLPFCEGGWSEFGHFDPSGWTGPEIPLVWSQRVGELNKRPIDPRAWRGIYSDEFFLNKTWRGRKVQGVCQDAVSEAFDRHLGPIATDPSRESWEDFQIRARFHWMARVQMAETFGFRPAGKESEWPNLDRDIRWLFRRQVNKETFDEIADSRAGEYVEAASVKTAIDRLSRIIGLKRKPGRPTGKSVRSAK